MTYKVERVKLLVGELKMPENKQERIVSGEITVTPSSDEAIRAKVEQLSREVHGLPAGDNVIEGDTYPPRAIAAESGEDQKLEASGGRLLVDISQLTHRDSALGFRLHKKRVDKKAA